MALTGHGTVVNGSVAQGDARVHVNNNGGSSHYEAGYEQDVINETGTTLTSGQVVFLTWNGSNLTVTGTGKRASGSVSSNGSTFIVSDPGDTDLNGEAEIAGGYDGYGGEAAVTCADIGGAASYLE